MSWREEEIREFDIWWAVLGAGGRPVVEYASLGAEISQGDEEGEKGM